MTGLARRLGTLDATAIGLGSMLGAGVFAVFAPAAASAGGWLPVAILVAGFVAYCNAVASAQLAAAFPSSGGTYVYGRERLGPWWGFTAGWGFVVGKTASCAAMALTFATHVAPGAARPVAVAAVVVLVGVNLLGITRTAFVTKALLVFVLLVLALVIALSLVDGPAADPEAPGPVGPLEVLQAAGLLFFAFAGYARVATLGEEVRDPGRTIPRAILGALACALLLYLALGLTLLHTLGAQRLSQTTTPLATAVPEWSAVVTAGAAAASLGALLALIAGVGRTTLAMAREHDLPHWLATVHPRFAVPHRAELAVGAVVCVLVLTTDLRAVIGFSSFGVLVYYAIANLSAATQTGTDRRRPKTLNIVGVVGCLLLAATLPTGSVLVGLAVFAVGLAGRALTAS
ncbi:APC family permease [Actinophytocola glycyrrhizae]|uniref:APC family permease n=1 Tax=Actinophytocola glycyrrhizae TaxID=2044873 RepID=A0ABV9S2P4_9PSEU